MKETIATRLSPPMLDAVAERFRILGEPMRLRILHALRGREHTVSELVELTSGGQANVSKHLQLLHRQGFVQRRKDGTSTWYAIQDPAVFELCDLVCGGVEEDLDRRRRELKLPRRP
ncbi:MAG: metalloregulator ArsR/SmtB family transcription factor [Gemmatimonadota bacterium]|nr:metalloregulator ArsR/SmtB family transcription factor [Gemmatimonadota bacterium]